MSLFIASPFLTLCPLLCIVLGWSCRLFSKKVEGKCTLMKKNRAIAHRGPSCLMTTNTIGGIDHASSYDFFKAAVAVDMICARNQPPLQGIATGIGEFSLNIPFSINECWVWELGLGLELER